VDVCSAFYSSSKDSPNDDEKTKKKKTKRRRKERKERVTWAMMAVDQIDRGRRRMKNKRFV
jgi:hypothetical protein